MNSCVSIERSTVTQVPTPHRAFLSSGTEIAYGDYGTADGIPVVFLHGSPGCRFEAADQAEVAQRLGLRLVAPERAGLGHSDMVPKQTLLASARDVLELLAHLKIERFVLISYSGGAGSLYALRHLAPDRVLCAVDVAGFAPVADHRSLRTALAPLDRFFFILGQIAPMVFRFAFSPIVRAARHRNPARLARVMRSSLSSVDKAWLAKRTNLDQLHADVAEACRQGVAGPAQDALQLYGKWGFSIEDSSAPLLIYCGDQNRFAPHQFGHWKASRVPSSVCRIYKDVGHLGIIDRLPEILRALTDTAIMKPIATQQESSKK